MSHDQLKARQRAERHEHAEGIALRIHRALSWLKRSEVCDDEDGRFLFLWIEFNSAYDNDLGEQRTRPSRNRIPGPFSRLFSSVFIRSETSWSVARRLGVAR